MPDISMCKGGPCPQKEKCFRYRVEPNPWRQSYFMTPPLLEDGNCEHFSLAEASGYRLRDVEKCLISETLAE